MQNFYCLILTENIIKCILHSLLIDFLLTPLWRVYGNYMCNLNIDIVCAGLNHRKKMKAELSRLIP